MTTGGRTTKTRRGWLVGIIITVAVIIGGVVFWAINGAPYIPWDAALMHVNKDMAGLIAQVFPTILLALLLEGRIAYRRNQRRWYRRWARAVRGAAILVSALATFMCLMFLGYDGVHENVWLNLTVSVSTLMLFLATIVIALHVLDAQDSEEVGKEIDDIVHRRMDEIGARIGRR